MSSIAPQTFAFGRFRLEGLDGKLLLNGHEVALPARLRQLLSILVEHPDQWLRDEWLAHALWPKAVPPQEELERLVRELRGVLDSGADGVATLQSQSGRGVRLVIPVRMTAGAEAERVPPRSADRAARGDSAAPPAEAGSGRRRMIAPGRFTALLLGAAAIAGTVGWALRWATRSAEATPHAVAVEGDPIAVRAAASAELAKGVTAARGHDFASIDEAIRLFDAAKAIEPGFAEARAALAHALVRRGDMARAKREAEVALVLEPDLAEAHAALAFTRLYADWNPALAQTTAESAIALNAVQTAGRRALAWSLAAQGGLDGALDQLRRARPLGGFDPELATDEGRILLAQGNSREARLLAAQAIRIEPTFAAARELAATIYLIERRLGAAETELELRDRLLAGASASDERIRQSLIGGIEPPDAGEAARLLRARAEAAAGAGEGGSANRNVEAARIFAQFGDRDLAFRALERAVARHEAEVVMAWVDPALAPIRATPHFRDLLARAGIAAPVPPERAGS